MAYRTLGGRKKKGGETMGETNGALALKTKTNGGLKWLREYANIALLLIDDAKLATGRWTCATDQFVAVELSKMSEPFGVIISHKSVEAFRYENGRKSFERTRSVEIPPPPTTIAPTGNLVVDENPQDYPEEPEHMSAGELRFYRCSTCGYKWKSSNGLNKCDKCGGGQIFSRMATAAEVNATFPEEPETMTAPRLTETIHFGNPLVREIASVAAELRLLRQGLNNGGDKNVVLNKVYAAQRQQGLEQQKQVIERQRQGVEAEQKTAAALERIAVALEKVTAK